MLTLKNITKSYTTGDFTQVALNGINLNFRENEFVAILGASGSGKTTFLNVVGGLDRSDSGELLINGKSTKEYRDEDWDAYRNNSVGFVFQNYNLITHLNIIDNIAMGMTLSGVPSDVKKQRALEVLDRVVLKEHAHKKPNQLSSGQMQRIAIARALANDPDIILADEPTGALDTETSKQVMDLIKEIAQDKLAIMVTHNPKLAQDYADRIIEFKDGKIISDTNPLTDAEVNPGYELKKTKMSFLTALKLSANNIRTKKGRTLLTVLATSIGIIGIALILALSNGFNEQLKNLEAETLTALPINILQSTVKIDPSVLSDASDMLDSGAEDKVFTDEQYVYPTPPATSRIMHTNIFTEEYIEYIEALDPKLISGISYSRMLDINILKKDGDTATIVKNSMMSFPSYPKSLVPDHLGYLEDYYDVLAGSYPTGMNDIVLIVDKKNGVGKQTLQAFGIDHEVDSIAFDDIIGTEFKVILNNDFYKEEGDLFVMNGDPKNLIDLYNSENAITMNVVGILRVKENVKMSVLSAGFTYSDELSEFLIADAANSDIVLKQLDSDYNVLTGGPIDGVDSAGVSVRDTLLTEIGGNATPYTIAIYPKDFDSKELIVDYLNKFNEGLAEEDKVAYMDLAGLVADMTGGFINGLTYGLIALASISLIVALIMVGIITYISVLERTKEIGILRALGARKKDITRVFNAETFIIGGLAGVFGILVAVLITIPINIIMENVAGLSNVAQLNPLHAILLILISLALTLLGGTIPARMAAKKDPVDALRTE